jgi:hypothetical protein
VIVTCNLPRCSANAYTLLPSDYMIGPTSSVPELCLTWPKASPPSSDGIDWQIGSAFMQTVYSVFRCDMPVLLLHNIFSCKKLATALTTRSLPLSAFTRSDKGRYLSHLRHSLHFSPPNQTLLQPICLIISYQRRLRQPLYTYSILPYRSPLSLPLILRRRPIHP